MPYKDYEQTKASVLRAYRRHKREDPTFMEKRRLAQKEKRRRNKAAAFAYYGHECARCKITDARVLDFDHIADDGHEEGHNRSHLADGLVTGLRKWEDYQLLCANCNRIKYYEWCELQGREKQPEKL